MKYGLGDDIIRKIHDVFTDYPQVDKAILYRSRAKGTFKPGSDIDLTLFGEDLDLKILNQISFALDDLYMPYELDLSVYDYIESPDFLNHIKRVGIEFYCKK